MAGSTFFNDLNSDPQNVYQCCNGWTVSGTGTVGTSFTTANEFTAMASGSVSQIDLGVGYVTGVNSFYAAVYTDNNGLPGTQLDRWDNLSSQTTFGQCCGLVTISNITGLTLTAGQSYFMILGPENINDTSWLAWNLNSTNTTGTEMFSTDGGNTWTSNGTQTLGAFDILGGGGGTTPEPLPCFCSEPAWSAPSARFAASAIAKSLVRSKAGASCSGFFLSTRPRSARPKGNIGEPSFNSAG